MPISHFLGKYPHTGICIALLGTILLYYAGLDGRFLFDDYPQLVLNENIKNIHSSTDLMRLIASGNAGPSGRPIALITFAAQIAITGLDPFPLKLFNLTIHLVNGILLYKLLRRINPQLFKTNQKPGNYIDLIPIAAASWWLLNPMALTSVLYTVQRMNALSATFTLAGLILYTKGRATGKANGNLSAILSLIALTGLAYLTKENGILTIGYAYLLEIFIFKWKDADRHWQKLFYTAKNLQIPSLIILTALIIATNDFGSAFNGRPFNLEERLLTESRVLWFYARQIIVPDITELALYHDNFPLSKTLLQPTSTLVSIIGHALSLALVVLIRNSNPAISLGVSWFYVGHLAESTIFPLELVFEHRNYLPSAGLLLAVCAIPASVTFNSRHKRLIIFAIFSLIVGAACITGYRANSWGDPLYPLKEAATNPFSSRANYDASVSLLQYIKDQNNFSQPLIDKTEIYLRRAIINDENALSPFVTLLDLYVSTNTQPPNWFWPDFITRARSSLVHPAVIFSFKNLNDLLFLESPIFTPEQAETIYKSILENPKAGSIVKAHTWFIYGLLKGKQKNTSEKLDFVRKSIELKANILEIRLIYIGFLIDDGAFDKAQQESITFKRLDRFQLYSKQLDDLLARIPGPHETELKR